MNVNGPWTLIELPSHCKSGTGHWPMLCQELKNMKGQIQTRSWHAAECSEINVRYIAILTRGPNRN